MRARGFLQAAAGDDPAVVRVVGALLVTVFVQGIGASAVLPLLPLFLRRHGTSDAAVGAVMASFFVAGLLTQYVAGHLTDRAGHRPVIIGGLVLYALASVGFLLDVGAGGYTGLRGTQGVGSGAVQVASLALVGLIVPLERRGRAFSAVFGAQLAGMGIGPLAGSLSGLAHLRWLFVGTAIASLVAVIPVVIGTRGRAERGQSTDQREALVVSRALVGVALVGVSVGLVTGVYETCWSLLLNSRGAAAWQIGLSWTLFALPFAAFSPTAGRLADRLDRKRIVIAAVLASCAFGAAYPFIRSVAWLVGLGAVEAIAVALAFPAAQSMLSQVARPESLGRAQGLFTTAETAAIAMAAAASGALFGVARWVPFVSAAAGGMLLVLAMPPLWRGVPGRASGPPVDLGGGGAAEVVALGAATSGTAP
jgi:DHA1 family multidrug resistance protein-like MFS transporter